MSFCECIFAVSIFGKTLRVIKINGVVQESVEWMEWKEKLCEMVGHWARASDRLR